MKTLLIVEDVAFNRELLYQLLEHDYQLLTAIDGAEGLELVEAARPDLILLDLSLPRIDGWEVARRLKASTELRHIPIVALTAHAMRDDEAKARASGCDDYLRKPIDEDQLFAKIAHFLAEGPGP